MQVLLTIVSLIATIYVRLTCWTITSAGRSDFVIPVAGVRQPGVSVLSPSADDNDKGAFLASCGYIVGMLVGAVFALYPNVLPASTGSNLQPHHLQHRDRRAWPARGLVWWSIGMVLALAYFVFVYRMFRGKVKLEEGGDHGY